MSETKVIPSISVSKILNVYAKDKIEFLLVNDEEVELAFTNKFIVDFIWFTNKRIIIYREEETGLWGRKGTFMIYPFSNISSFTAKTIDTFSESRDFEIHVNGIPQVTLKFHAHARLPIKRNVHLISSKIV